MRRYFNTEGLCEPEEHYMVRLDSRLENIKSFFVDRGKYFVINRGRQYGKTTTLRALAEYLRDDYLVVSMDFQMMSTFSFENEKKFPSVSMNIHRPGLHVWLYCESSGQCSGGEPDL